MWKTVDVRGQVVLFYVLIIDIPEGVHPVTQDRFLFDDAHRPLPGGPPVLHDIPYCGMRDAF